MTGCRGRREHGQAVRVGLVLLDGREVTAASQVLDDTRHGPLEHLSDLARRQARQLDEADRGRVRLAVHAVQEPANRPPEEK